MRIRKIVIPFITLLILVSQLGGCAFMNSHEALEEIHNGSEVVIEFGEVDHSKIELENGMTVDFNKADVSNPDIDSTIIDSAYAETENSIAKEEFYSICKNAYSAIWKSDIAHGESEDHLGRELMWFDFYIEEAGYLSNDTYRNQYKEWRNQNHPNPIPEFTFVSVDKPIYIKSGVVVGYLSPCTHHSTKEPLSMFVMSNKVLEDAKVSENGLWVVFEDLGRSVYLPGDQCTFENSANIGTEQSEIEVFNKCEETVYATSTVNIRGTYSTEGDLLGQLYRGQSMTRIGVGTGEAKGWSKLITDDGNIVYVSSKYLSLYKPSSDSGSGNNSGNNSSGAGGNPPVNNNQNTNIGNTDSGNTSNNNTGDGNVLISFEDLVPTSSDEGICDGGTTPVDLNTGGSNTDHDYSGITISP